jgi:hypothetical protein
MHAGFGGDGLNHPSPPESMYIDKYPALKQFSAVFSI